MRTIDLLFAERGSSPVEVALGELCHPVGLEVPEPPGLAGAFVRDAAQRPVDLSLLGALEDVDPATLEPGDRVALIRALERLKARVEGLQQAALAAVVDATTALGLEGEGARHEVGAALRLSPGTAAARTLTAQALVARMPEALAALQRGDITYLQARELVERLRSLSDEVAAKVAARVLPKAGEQTLAEFRRALERAIAAADPEGAQERHEKARAARAIRRQVLPEAMEGWFVTMTSPAAQEAWARLTARAKATQAELRAGAGIDPGLDALRVDALLDAIQDALAAPGTPRGGPAAPGPAAPGDPAAGARPAGPAGGTGPGGFPPLARCTCGGAGTVGVVVDLPTLLGLAQRPGELTGYGPIPAAMARELAANLDWERWVTHPLTGQLLDRSPKRYRPSDRLRRHVAAAQRRCAFPGCSKRAEACDTDHRVTFRRGGRTVVVNLGPLCRQHHNAKTHGKWVLTFDPQVEQWFWTSPLGQTYPAGTDPPLPT